MPRTFSSKIGWSLLLPLIFILLLVEILAFSSDPFWPSQIILIPVIGFIVHMFLNTYYIIDQLVLKVKCGFLYNTSIDIANIKKVTATNSALSAPALSLDRLQIDYGRYSSIMVSPKDKEEFISALLEINPHIHVDSVSHEN